MRLMNRFSKYLMWSNRFSKFSSEGTRIEVIPSTPLETDSTPSSKKFVLLKAVLLLIAVGVVLQQIGIVDWFVRPVAVRNQLGFKDCQKSAKNTAEFYSEDYQRLNQSIDPNGPQFAYYLWEGNITREDFEATMKSAYETLTFKIKDGKLYHKSYRDHTDASPFFRWTLMWPLLMTLHLYEIPDLDFTFFTKDEAICNLPFFSNNIDSSCGTRAGFAIPTYGVLNAAFGPTQIKKYETCLDWRFPLSDATPKAVWRGSTTGIPRITTRNYHDLWRVKLIDETRPYPDLFDVGLTAHIQMSDAAKKLMEKEYPLANWMDFGDFNRFGVMLDMDGNAWSDRFSRLLFSNRPIVKQDSPYKEFFRVDPHPKLATFFERNLTNLVEQTKSVLEKLKTWHGQASIKQEIKERREFAHKHLSQLGILRSLAYLLTMYSHKQTWEVQDEAHYALIHSDDIKLENTMFPKEFISSVSEHFKVGKIDASN